MTPHGPTPLGHLGTRRGDSSLDELTGSRGPAKSIGNYELGEKLGEGGFGTVYVARQIRPVQRMVALKLIKAGMDTGEVIARFSAERQALALMDHPNIARVYDAGTTEDGRPYFVMELIPGPPITRYCDGARLNTIERLRLFLGVCHGVQHAHQKGIIHRDLKPFNVLVVEHDGNPVAKVIDFGVAKATRCDSDEPIHHTMGGQLMGTPLYMSPEQAAAGEAKVDTRADIYSLGVVLYELLTGRTPFSAGRLKEVGYEGLRRIIVEETPPKPSTSIETLVGESANELALVRGTEPDRLTKLIRGDLDWIIMKALEKSPERRYQTVGELAADIQRHLTGEPVEASPPSVSYRVSRFVKRHRLAVAAAALVATSVIIGTGISVWQAVRATRMQVALQEALDASQQAISRMRNAALAGDSSLAESKIQPGLAALERIEVELAALDEKLEAQRARHGLLESTLQKTRLVAKSADITPAPPSTVTGDPATTAMPPLPPDTIPPAPTEPEIATAIDPELVPKSFPGGLDIQRMLEEKLALTSEMAEMEATRRRLQEEKRKTLRELKGALPEPAGDNP